MPNFSLQQKFIKKIHAKIKRPNFLKNFKTLSMEKSKRLRENEKRFGKNCRKEERENYF